MRIRIWLFSVTLLFILFQPLPSILVAQSVSGSITSDTTWSAGNVIIQDSVTVLNGITLTIQPGAVVKFNSGGILVVAGTLKAGGALGNPITFTSNVGSPAPGSWRNLSLLASASVSSFLNYCVFEYGGSGTNGSTIFYFTGAPAINISNTSVRLSAGHGINVRASSPRISTSTVRDNVGYGIYSDLVTNMVVDSVVASKNISGGIRIPINSSPQIKNSTIDSNGVGIFIDNSAAPTVQNNNIRYNNIGIQFTGVGATQPTIKKNAITNNTTWGFLNTGTASVIARENYWGSDFGPFHASLNPTGLGDKVSNNVDFQPWTILALAKPVAVKTATQITSNTTWYADSVYWIKPSTGNVLQVNSGITLTIKPGVIVKFQTSARLYVLGTIVANGKTDSLVIFTSDRDDPYGGDTNGDSTLTIPSRGIWDMVWLNAGANNNSVLNYCVFRFGSSSGNGNLRVDNSTPIITNISSTQSSYYGIFLNNNANVNLTNSTLGSNSYDGLLIYSSNPSIYGSKFIGNSRYGIYAASGSPHFTVRKSDFNGNSNGIVADAGASGATLVSMDSSNVSNNIGGGLYLEYGTGPQTFSYNRISNNGAYGLWCYNQDNLVTIVGDTITNNGQEGIVTSKAVINNNVLQGNRYPIALFGRVNSTYSGNSISGNTYNNALALRINQSQESFSDTLSAVFPPGMTSYVLIENTPGWGVLAGKTLMIKPGVIIKIDPTLYFRVDGTLLADASSGSPIVFTSYRDATYGGKTNLASDNSAPAPNDWQYVRIRTSTANASVLNNVIFKYGGLYSNANLWMDGTITLTTPVRNVISRKSGSNGIYVYDGQVVFESCTIDSNANYGLYIGGNRPSDVTVRTSTIQDNGSTGVQAVDNSAFREVSNCVIRRNNGWGIGVSNGTIDQVIQGNTVTNNNAGIYNGSPNVSAIGMSFIGNTVTDHAGDGILSSRARFIDNTIQRNRYPLAVWKRLGNIYTDNNGVDGNIISQNVYNNAIAIWQGAISDTLKATFPQAITSKTYVAIYDFTVDASTTLVIEPGVKVKFQQIPVNDWRYFNVYGTLKAEGTPADPIVFTSWRDSVAGGKTTALTDYAPPAPGDWYYIIFRNTSGASVVRHCQFKYGGRDGQQAVYFQQNPGMVFSNNLVRKSMASGILVYNTAAVIDSTTVDSCAHNGIWVYPIAASNLTLTNSRLLNNGQYGLYVQDPAKLSLLSNCDISRNGYSGVYVQNNSVPLSVIGNTIANNASHGLYLISRNDAQDTLLLIAGNKIRNNTLAGIYSSRAHVVDDSITGNRYAIGVVGQLSLNGTSNVAGNVYQGNVISGNTYNDVLVTEEVTFGWLGASFPPGYTSKVVAVRGSLQVPSGATLTIAPGTILKFPKEYTGGAGGTWRFRVDGVLKSEGTLNNKIVFTSWKDDSYGGDSNGDSNGSVPGTGDWDMIYLVGASNNSSHLLQTIVRYGGLASSGNIRLDNNSAPIDSSFISYSSNYGIYTFNASPSIYANEIHHNVTGVYASGSSNPVVQRNNIHENSSYGLNNTTSNTINATNNYWGQPSGPFVNQGSDQNLSGTGDRIGINPGAVTYRPFLTTRSGILLGDVSENGTISAFDGALVLRAVVGLDTLRLSQRLAADVSADGSVSAFDASLILRYVVGLITGFPGLGKVAADASLASSYQFLLENGQAADEVELVLSLNGTSRIFASEIHLTFDPSQLTPVAMKTTGLSAEMSALSNFGSGTAHIALAGTAPVTSAGDFVRIVFKTREKFTDLSETSIRFAGFRLNETELLTSKENITELPSTFGIDQNYPNPFNPTTTIQFQLPTASRVTITIYDLLGQEVRQLLDEEREPGYYRMMWDGTGSLGSPVASGVYFYRIHAKYGNKDFTVVKRMLLLR